MKPVADLAEVSLRKEITFDQDISCDRDRCLQVLTNLLSNAIKYSPKGEAVLVKTSSSKDHFLRFSVTDSGPGIAQNQLHKLFGLFQQVDSSDSRAKQAGTGLGLAISKAIVEEHGGKIGVYTEIGEGATFWFELPEQSPGTKVTDAGRRKELVERRPAG
jgi:signal transduction histidine kinase